MSQNNASIYGAPKVRGDYEPRFASVIEAFAENFSAYGELGASLTVEVDGKTVLDLWGGQVTEGGADWACDTVHVVFSCTKAATALVLHLLARDGALDLDAPLSEVWPELTAAQQGATARMVLITVLVCRRCAQRRLLMR